MSGQDTTFLAIIAAATAVMALIQVGVIVALAVYAKRINALVGRVERDVQPIIDKLTTVSGEAARVASLAAGQAERFDRMVGDLGQRLHHAAGQAQSKMTRPAREATALMAAVRAAALTLRDARRQRHARGFDEDDPLFIG
ncbi:MAG: hypothetical protein KJ061_17670 [Vicinamibacteraceae bacterium]|nr:hypothetical protein [Vicinamibacteraceae bacterium]